MKVFSAVTCGWCILFGVGNLLLDNPVNIIIGILDLTLGIWLWKLIYEDS